MNKGVCIVCKKRLKRNIGKPIHRKCWLMMRDFDERYLDCLFCVNKQDKTPAKSISVKPCDKTEEDFLTDAIEELNSEILEKQPLNYELDDSVSYEIDIAGNTIEI
jgi:hypothetical protein